MGYKITYETEAWASATKSELRDVQREVFRLIGLWWHRTKKAIHFTDKGARLYKFAPRAGNRGSGKKYKGSYAWHKVTRKAYHDGIKPLGENKPNVWSGTSRASVMASNKVIPRATSSTKGHVEIIMPAPALNYRNPKSKTAPSEEITRVAPSEESEMSQIAPVFFEKRLLRNRRKRKLIG